MNAEPAHALAAAQRKGSYLARHWRGELSLLKSFWFDAIAVSVVIFPLSALVSGYFAAHFQQRPGVAVTQIVMVFAVGLCILLWSLVGLWRAARVYTGRRVWSVSARVVTLCWLGLIALYWIGASHKLITTYYNCTTGRDFGPVAAFFQLGPCEVAWYEKHGLVVRRLARDSFGPGVVDPFQ